MTMKYFNEIKCNSTGKKPKINDNVYVEIKKAYSSITMFFQNEIFLHF